MADENEEVRPCDLTVTREEFYDDDVVVVDSKLHDTAKISAKDMLPQNVLAGRIAPAFVPNVTEAKAGQPYMYGGNIVVAKEDYQGPWDASKFESASVSKIIEALKLYINDNSYFGEDNTDLWATVTGYYLSKNGSTYSSCQEESSIWSFCYKEVAAGQTYQITSFAGQNARLWSMFDANDDRIAISSDDSLASEKTEIVTIPEGVVKLGVNFRNNEIDFPTIKIKKIKLEVLGDSIDYVDGDIIPIIKNGIVIKSTISNKLFIENLFIDNNNNSWTLVPSSYLINSGANYGSCQTADSSWAFYYKEVSAGQIYKIKSWAGQAARLWYMFDASGNKVSMSSDSSTIGEKTETITIPEGVVKLAFNCQNEHLGVIDIQLKVLSIPESHVRDKKELEAFSRMIGAEKTFISESESWTEVAGYLLDHRGTTYDTCKSESSSWNIYYKEVSAKAKYRITSFAGQTARLWYMFDASGNKVAMSADASLVGEKTEIITIPEGVVKLAVNCRNDNLGVFNAEIELISIPESHVRDREGAVSDKLYGKTIVFCGDSITEGTAMGSSGTTDYSPITFYNRVHDANLGFEVATAPFYKNFGFNIAVRHNMKYYNDGWGGSTIQNLNQSKSFSLPNGRYTKLPDQIDYLVIWFGWNDIAYGTLGTIDDGTNQSFYGAFNVVIPYLQNKYPLAKICLVVPYCNSADHREAVRLLADKWGLAYFDFYGPGTPLFFGKEEDVGVLESVVTANKEKFLCDGTHPNAAGYVQLADMLEAFLMTI